MPGGIDRRRSEGDSGRLLPRRRRCGRLHMLLSYPRWVMGGARPKGGVAFHEMGGAQCQEGGVSCSLPLLDISGLTPGKFDHVSFQNGEKSAHNTGEANS